MRTPGGPRGRARPARTALLLATLVTLPVLALSGCAAAGTSQDSSSTPSSGSPAPTPTVSVPADGVSLAVLGFTNGPVDRVFVPVGAQVSSRVDQANNVTLVLTSPAAADLAGFYRRTSVGNGFRLTADDPATATLAFAGFGWTGTFTGDTQASALLLRPAP